MADPERPQAQDEAQDGRRDGPIQVVVVNGASSSSEEQTPEDWVKTIVEALNTDEGRKAHKRAAYINPVLLFLLVLLTLLQLFVKSREKEEGLTEKDREYLKVFGPDIAEITKAAARNNAPPPYVAGPLGNIDKHLGDLVTQAAIMNARVTQIRPLGPQDKQVSDIAATLAGIDSKIALLSKYNPPPPSIDVKVSPGTLSQGASTSGPASSSKTKDGPPDLDIELVGKIDIRDKQSPPILVIPVEYRNRTDSPILIYGTRAYLIDDSYSSELSQLTCESAQDAELIAADGTTHQIQVGLERRGKGFRWIILCTTFGFRGESRFTARYRYSDPNGGQPSGPVEKHYYTR